MKAKILLVEDEPDMAMIVTDTLRSEGYEVIVAVDGADGLGKFKSGDIDLIIADVMMPRMDGFSMAQEIRRISSSVPLLLLTAKSTVDDVEHGFDIGADDYLRKPFELRELIIRIRALLRRSYLVEPERTRYRIGRYIFDTSAQTLSIDGNPVLLSHFEASVLQRLVADIGQIVEASALSEAVWGCDDYCKRNSLHGYIHRLRAALSQDPWVTIINRRGYGYILVAEKPS